MKKNNAPKHTAKQTTKGTWDSTLFSRSSISIAVSSSLLLLATPAAANGYLINDQQIIGNTILSENNGIRLEAFDPYAFGADTVDGESQSTTLASVAGNTITNNKIINVSNALGSFGLRLSTYAESYDSSTATVSASSGSVTATAGQPLAGVTGNTVINNGSLIADTGISLESLSRSNAEIGGEDPGGGYGEATATATSNAFVSGNTIINNGLIDARGFASADAGEGIRIFANATANATSDADNSSNATSEAYAGISGNTISNSGTILVSNQKGIYLYTQASASSDADEGTPANANAAASSVAAAAVFGNTIENTGLIAAKDDDGITLHASADATADVSDSSTDSALIHGNTISNSGRIFSASQGIKISISETGDSKIFGNTISNTYGGRIISTDDGIEIDGDVTGAYTFSNTINNSGLIIADDRVVVSGNNYTISGTWNSDRDKAIRIKGDAGNFEGTESENTDGYNSLNLYSPAYLAGDIDLDTSANVRVTLTSGPSHSVAWSIKSDTVDKGQADQGKLYTWGDSNTQTKALLEGSVPWFVNEFNGEDGYDVYATIDPSAFAAAPNMLGDLSGMVSTMAKVGLEKNDLGRGLWLSVQGGKRDYKGDKTVTIDQETTHAGLAIGYAHRLSEDWRVSGMIGASQGRLEVGSFYSDIYSNSFKNKADGGFVGLHFAGSLGPVKMNVGISGGGVSHKDRRFVNDNLLALGVSHADSKYDSVWLSPEIGFAIPVKWDSGWSVTPSLSWRYSAQEIEKITENGSASEATVASRTLGVSEFNLGLDVTRAYGSGSSISGKLGYLYRDSVGDNKVSVTMIDDTRNVPFFYKDLSAGIVGIDWKQNIAGNVNFYLNANYIKGNNVEGGDVATGLKVDF